MKYIMYSDINYLFKYKKRVILLYIFFSLLSVFINMNSSTNIENILMLSFGNNLKFDSIGILEIIMYFLNLFFFLYLVIDVYIKDLLYNIDNLLLRIKPFNYIRFKNLCFILVMFFLKFIQYFICTLFCFILNKNFDFNVVYLYLIDSIYILTFQYLFILIYYIYVLFHKNTFVLFFESLLLILIIPKSIWEVRNHFIGLLLIFIIGQIMILFVFKKKNKSIIQNL
jgi:hypothetical protein